MAEAIEEPMAAEDGHEEHQPKGTLMVMALLVLLIVGLWVAVYGLLIVRG